MAGRRSGFSLIELLVVSGMVVVLLSLSLPALQSSLGTTRRTMCLSNLRSLGAALQMYRDENSSALPDVASMPVDPFDQSIIDVLEPHLEGGSVWHCPSDGQVYEQLGTSYEYFIGFYT